MEIIHIQMFGGFSLRVGENTIKDSDNRTKKVWLLLAYLICNRGQSVTQKKLIDVLWGSNSTVNNPENALRITLHRARVLLDTLRPNAGKELIVCHDGVCSWNSQIPADVDTERFHQLCTEEYADDASQLQKLLEAIDLYKGEFLEKQSSEIWVIPISTHYQNEYLNAVLKAVALLAQASRHAEAAQLCRRAAASEPYHELLHQLWMRELSAAGDQAGAAQVYEDLSVRLFDDFGIRPSPETRAAYRAAVHTLSQQTLPMDVVLEHLQEPGSTAGAMECDYDYFKVLCFAESRAMERSGKATHIVLLSVSGDPAHPLSKQTLHRVMDQLGSQIRCNLRRGDTFSRCSVSQYIIMLPQANYENSCMVSRRILGAFRRAHPHVAANIHFMVQPLSPSYIVP